MEKQVLSVSQINEYIRSMMDNNPMLSNVAVQGEISNYKVYPSGHHYFTLKDTDSALKCVMFRSSAVRLRFRPENGAKVVAIGKISVYPRDGAYQLYCTAMMPDGEGDLQAAFEQLKKKLAAKGWFDPAHKKSLPKYPQTIGIVTSSAGAAIHDIIRILRKRYPLAQVKLLPVRVQGAEAPGEIAAAINYANLYNLADLLIVGRGGGSIEDLWAFNDEQVAQAIFQSEIPVISAVGHEPDVTISDYVADMRAATPSNAAEFAVPDQEALRQSLDSVCGVMATALQRQLKHYRQLHQNLAGSPALQTPEAYILQKKKDLSILSNRFMMAHRGIYQQQRQNFVSLTAKLDAMSPLKVLTRGYSVATTEEQKLIKSINCVREGDPIILTVSDGQIGATVTKIKEDNNG